jgi:uncharacterized protein (DUF488 family)
MERSEREMQPASSLRLYSIGHSNHELPAFLALLQRAGVTAVADVRSSPHSRRLPHFSRTNLEAALKHAGLAYAFLGDQLGGRPADPSLYDGDGRVSYERVRATQSFHQGIDRLHRALDRYTVAMLCGEADPLHCHRGLMIVPALAERGVAVAHLRKDGSVESPAEFERRLIELTGTDAGMLDGLFRVTEEDRKTWLAEAYRRQACKFAFRLQPEEDEA